MATQPRRSAVAGRARVRRRSSRDPFHAVLANDDDERRAAVRARSGSGRVPNVDSLRHVVRVEAAAFVFAARGEADARARRAAAARGEVVTVARRRRASTACATTAKTALARCAGRRGARTARRDARGAQPNTPPLAGGPSQLTAAAAIRTDSVWGPRRARALPSAARDGDDTEHAPAGSDGERAAPAGLAHALRVLLLRRRRVGGALARAGAGAAGPRALARGRAERHARAARVVLLLDELRDCDGARRERRRRARRRDDTHRDSERELATRKQPGDVCSGSASDARTHCVVRRAPSALANVRAPK